MKYTKLQIEEAIAKWQKYMFDHQMINESEYQKMLEEGSFTGLKRAGARLKHFGKKIASTVKDAAKAVHDIIKPNKGAQMLLTAMDKLAKHKIDLSTVTMYASPGEEGKYYPVVEFKVEKKRNVILGINPGNPGAKPKILNDFKNFILKECNWKPGMKVTAIVASINLAKLNDAAEKKLNENEELMLESKLTDYIDKNKLSKEEALKPEMIKKFSSRKGLNLTHDSKEKIKAAIEKHFAKKDAIKVDDSKKNDQKTSKNDKKETSSKVKDDKFSSGEKIEQSKKEEPKNVEEPKKDVKPTLTVLDNDLLEVIPKKTMIGFKFSKTKAEIEIDYAFSL